MRKVYLEGILGEKFGEEWNLAVNSPAEAMQAISAQRSGFKQFLIEGENIQGYDVLVGDEPVNTEECLMINPDMSQSYTFAPIIAGSKNAGLMMVLGLALIIMTGGAAAIGLAGIGAPAVGSSVVVTAANASIMGANAVIGTSMTIASASQAAALHALALQGTTAGLAMAGGKFLGMGLLLGGASMMLAPDTPDGNQAKKAENYLFSGPINTVKQGSPIPLIYGRMVTGSATVMGSLFTSSSRSEGHVDLSRKLVGIGGFRNDGDSHGNSAPAGRYQNWMGGYPGPR